MKKFGKYVRICRKDGKIFVGQFEGVKYTPRGTLIVVRDSVEDTYRDLEGQEHTGYNSRYRSVYLEESTNVESSDYFEEILG